MTKGNIHHHLRKRILKNKETFPHKNKYKRFLDHIIYAIGVAGPIFTLPQLYKVWIEQNVAGVSLLSWGGFLIIAIVWLLYGIAHKEWPIIVTYSAWIAVEFPLVVGILVFG
ncbi:hypothetical protein HOA92_06525 [archaeon]|jgi:uncharacterized protein with PQ loop repeat|nr:hypothetical protein [archaeon]MBT6762666.1 hypothetical protein [archaeon]